MEKFSQPADENGHVLLPGIMLKIKLYVCRILCENFIQIGQKMKK